MEPKKQNRATSKELPTARRRRKDPREVEALATPPPGKALNKTRPHAEEARRRKSNRRLQQQTSRQKPKESQNRATKTKHGPCLRAQPPLEPEEEARPRSNQPKQIQHPFKYTVLEHIWRRERTSRGRNAKGRKTASPEALLNPASAMRRQDQLRCGQETRKNNEEAAEQQRKKERVPSPATGEGRRRRRSEIDF